MRRYSRSEMWSFKRCRRRWWLSNYRGLQRRGCAPGQASVGSRVHSALAAAYRGGGSADLALQELMRLRDVDRAEWERQQEANLEPYCLGDGSMVPAEDSAESWKEWQDEHDLAVIMITGYFEWVAETGVDAGLEIISAEQELEVPIFPGATAIGKLDLRVVDHSQADARLFLDHKTTGSFSGMEEQLRLNEQLLHYQLLEILSTTGEEPCAGGAFNLLRRVKRTPRATPPFYQRITTWHSIGELRSYWQRMVGTVGDIIAVTRALDSGVDHRSTAYPTPEASCAWQCPFYAACPMSDDPMMDFEGFLAFAYERHDPLERYTDLDHKEGA